MLRPIFRWSLFALFVAGGLLFLNSAIFHGWVADVPPRLYPEIHHAISLRHQFVSIALLVLSGLSLLLLRPKKQVGSQENRTSWHQVEVNSEKPLPDFEVIDYQVVTRGRCRQRQS